MDIRVGKKHIMVEWKCGKCNKVQVTAFSRWMVENYPLLIYNASCHYCRHTQQIDFQEVLDNVE